MRLSDGLRLGPRMALAFTGAGGKSTAMGIAATELAEDIPVVMTVTTKLAYRQSQLAEKQLIVRNVKNLEEVPALLDQHQRLLVTGESEKNEPKWSGLKDHEMNVLWRHVVSAGGVLLIEADGARGKSLKVPRVGEPVVPNFVHIVTPVVGLDSLGKPLTDEFVHRPQEIARALNLPEGATLTHQHLAELLISSHGALGNLPGSAEVRILLNKADNESRLEQAAIIAEKSLREERIQAVLTGSMPEHHPVKQVIGRVSGIILAAGGSSRLQSPKQLIEFEGRPLVLHAVQAAREAELSPIIVVVGAEGEALRGVLENESVYIIENAAWASGQSSSLRLGLTAAEAHAEAAVFLLADMPFVEGALVKALVEEHRQTLTPIIAPRSAGLWGNPVLFDRVTFQSLHALDGDRGGKQLFDRFRVGGLPWDDSVLFDLDTPDDLERLAKGR